VIFKNLETIHEIKEGLQICKLKKDMPTHA
jgi:hypothetical protein